MMKSNQLAAILIILVTACLLIISLKPHEQVYVYVKEQAGNLGISNMVPIPIRVDKMYKSWKKCMVDETASFRGNSKETWSKIAAVVRKCEQPHVKILKIQDFSNSDETKRHILPVTENSEPAVVITLGVGHDTRAEEMLLNKVGNKSIAFYGADPMVEINEKLYSKFGKFFPFAVSGKPGLSVANVLEGNAYVDKLVIHVDAIYFLTKLVGLKFFDTIWMDAEGAEYELFPFIDRDGDFDQNDVVFCQMNIEIHMPNDKKKELIHDFLFRTLDDERYAFFQPVQANHLRLFFVNFENEKCVEKYFPTDLGNFTTL